MRFRLRTVVVLLSLAAIAVPISAHHSMNREVDTNRRVVVTGVITKVDWTNPHVWIYLDVQVAGKSDIGWGIESAPPNGLQTQGITASALAVGTRVTVEGFPALNSNVRRVAGISLTLPDGKQLDIRDTWSVVERLRR